MMAEGFTQFPNMLLESVVGMNLSGPELEVFLVTLRYTVGFQREIHRMSLSFYSRATGRHRTTIHRAIHELCERQIIRRTAESTQGRAASFAINPPELWIISSKPTVSRNGTVDATIADHENATVSHSANRTVSEPATGVFHSRIQNCSTLANQERNKESFKEKKKEKRDTPLPPSRGNSVSKKAETEAPISFSFQDSKSKKAKSDPLALIKHFEDELGIKANLSKTELREFQRMQDKCNVGLFQSAFFKTISEIKGVPVPDHLRRPGDHFMMVAKYAQRVASNNGGRG
jgi:phage replication O-like protein O